MTRKWRPTVLVRDKKGGKMSVRVEIEIDWTKLSQMLAQKAVRSKSGKSTAMHGTFKCKLYETKAEKKRRRNPVAVPASAAIPLTELDDLILGRKTPQQVVEEGPSDQRLADAFNESGVFKRLRVIPGSKTP